MLTITHNLTGKALFEADDITDEHADGLKINTIQKHQEEISITIKTIQIANISVFIIQFLTPLTENLVLTTTGYALIMNFVLTGHLEARDTDGSAERMKIAAKSHYTLLPAGKKQICITTKSDTKLFLVCFTPGIFSKLLTSDEEIASKARLAKKALRTGRPITLQMGDIIESLLSGADRNRLHRLLFAAKILELLHFDIEQLTKADSDQPVSSLKSNDLEKLERAKVMIGENLKSPYSLVELSHQVGLNDFKLKKGFREAYGTTVFGYLFNLRMDKAKTMLSSGKHMISEIANEVGYKNAHHFSVAFKKRFGYLPSKNPYSI